MSVNFQRWNRSWKSHRLYYRVRFMSQSQKFVTN